jgi:4-hydroxybenzoate polyprenyltransferase
MVGISKADFEFTASTVFILLAASFQIAGAYPLTQIYQHKEDLKDGVVSLSYKLGYQGTFVFTALMFVVCNVLYYLYFTSIDRVELFYTLQLFFVPIIVFFSFWFLSVSKNNEAANFKNTMRMNLIAALCMNTCFVVLYFNK